MRQHASCPAPDRWTHRRLAGFGVRALIVVIPFVAAMATIAVLGRAVPTSSRFAGIERYALIFGSSWLVMAVAHRMVHRLLPLAALLEMSLLFPERAPSRLQLARRAASRRDLDDLLSGRTDHPDESTQEAAERILALVSALSEHDRGTRGHSERVRVLTDLIAERLGLSGHDRDRLRWAALLHDIGKLHVPVEILNKPGKPSAREWEILRHHPHHGAQIAAPLLGWLGEWGDVIRQHHEKFDGSGYPLGLAGHQICLGARIVSVADAYDVMTAARAYKKPVGRASALRELVACSGRHFDPDVVRALITVPQRRMLLTMGPVSWLTGLPLVGQAPTVVSASLTSQAGAAVGAVALTGTAALTPLAGTTSTVSTDSPRPAVTATVPARPADPTDPARPAAPKTGRKTPGATPGAGVTPSAVTDSASATPDEGLTVASSRTKNPPSKAHPADPTRRATPTRKTTPTRKAAPTRKATPTRNVAPTRPATPTRRTTAPGPSTTRSRSHDEHDHPPTDQRPGREAGKGDHG